MWSKFLQPIFFKFPKKKFFPQIFIRAYKKKKKQKLLFNENLKLKILYLGTVGNIFKALNHYIVS